MIKRTDKIIKYSSQIASPQHSYDRTMSSDETLVASVFSDDPISIGDSEYIVGFSTKELLAVAGEDVNVYIYCNPASSLTGQTFDADGMYTLTTPRNQLAWASGAMFMSNATENTLPSIEQQKHGISTGVVFKAKLAPGASSGITLGGGTGGKVYIYGNKLYESWSAVLAAAEDEEANPALAVAVRLVLNDVDNAFDEDDEATLTALAKEGFTTYSQDSDGSYYCYYYYWNKHNDNSATTAGIMEFAVVRNNVYKLSISDIYHYGHPDPIDPNGGDEEAESEYYYFTVDVEILPWILRENSMTF